MKKVKIIVVALLAGLMLCCFNACSGGISCGGCAGAPEWLGGEKPKYTITYDVEGNITSGEFKEGTIPQQPETPTKEGYVFKGWYLDEAFTEEYKFDKPLDGDKTLYALL